MTLAVAPTMMAAVTRPHHFGRDVHVARQKIAAHLHETEEEGGGNEQERVFARQNGDDEAGPAIARQVEPGKAGMKAQHFQRARHARHQPADDLRAHDDPFQRQAKMIGKSGA